MSQKAIPLANVMLAVLMGGTLPACMPRDAPQTQSSETPTPPRIVEPLTFPEGVYFFGTVGNSYRVSLAAFRKAHPELDCRYFGADDTIVVAGGTAVAYIIGHTIVCTDTATNAQEETVP